MEFKDPVFEQIIEHAEQTFPKEACGLVLQDQSVIRMHNYAANPRTEFKIQPMEYLQYEKRTLAVYHSHPNRLPTPTEMDKASCEAVGKPYLIVGVPTHDTVRVLPSYLRPPLLERPFVYGVYDCYSLAVDYFKQTLCIEIPEIMRPAFNWWKTGEVDAITKNFEAQGFKKIPEAELKKHDVLLIANTSNKIPSHIAVYLGDGSIMHHCVNCLSKVDQYNDRWRAMTVGVLRYAG